MTVDDPLRESASRREQVIAANNFEGDGQKGKMTSALYGLDVQTRIGLIRHGIPAAAVADLSNRMGMGKELLLSSLGLPRATISRKERAAALLSRDESERLLGVASLIDMVQTMVEQSGDPAGFDAARWVAGWLSMPLPALAGATPASYMDTFEGQKLVADLLAMTQSGAYA
ncbi:antitoxin Xre-like helix-turn-helix domain-containing protein [Rugamonas sp.]|uniref:antitoxin Xre-like helix-turn-helix domain-containing protein n=1 Tax=Rugamonas sp. TaxID=1926287 RepID=UPI0025DEE668|nr:antitoxin Xre-like helix-turn-helix domain-containing protein [Rugamonas sp.]